MPGFELFGDLEKKEVQDVLDNGVLMRYGFDGMRNGHWKTKELEEALANRMQVKHAQVVSSGTTALTTALAVAGIGHGDEVIIPTFTFVATFEAIMMTGAIPVMADIDDTLTLDPASIEERITEQTKAIMPVHMCGSMADLGALKKICDAYSLLLIEDACQAIGGSYEGKPLGSIGDMGCFSFDYVKTITCGEGGALITNNEAYQSRAHMYADHGHDHMGTDRGEEDHLFLGYNFRISELNSAVGLAQLRRLDDFINLQKRNYGIIRTALSGVEGVLFRRIPERGVPNYSFLNIFLPNKALARNSASLLKEAGIDGCFYWYDNNWHYYRKWGHFLEAVSVYPLNPEMIGRIRERNTDRYPKSDTWLGRNISILIKLSWSEAEVQARAEKMAKVLNKALRS
ncbi:MAG: DegT/DnrJ/EryC1/StrS family aminotransferase [Flavobacteriaceae bacterium]|nr:DegT/DnrJ/EryC1/StrS family aminotransferase [Flavobacteriaceae bacterium]